MTYHYNEQDYETATAALQASVADYLAAGNGSPQWRLDHATKYREEIIQAARKDGTAYYFDENGSEFWGVYEHDTDGDPCDFTQEQIEAAFDAVAGGLWVEIGKADSRCQTRKGARQCVRDLGHKEDCEMGPAVYGEQGLGFESAYLETLRERRRQLVEKIAGLDAEIVRETNPGVAAKPDLRTAPYDVSRGFQIRFDSAPGPDGCTFIEAEDLEGRSIRLGEWVEDGEYWLLRVAARDCWADQPAEKPATAKKAASYVEDGPVERLEGSSAAGPTFVPDWRKDEIEAGS